MNIESSGRKTVLEVKIEEIAGTVEVYPDVDPILAGSLEQQFLMVKDAIGYIGQLQSET